MSQETNPNNSLAELLNVALVSYASQRPHLDDVAKYCDAYPDGQRLGPDDRISDALQTIASKLQEIHGQWIIEALSRSPEERELDAKLKKVLRSIWFDCDGEVYGAQLYFFWKDLTYVLDGELEEELIAYWSTTEKYRRDAVLRSPVLFNPVRQLPALSRMISEGVFTTEDLTNEERTLWLDRLTEEYRSVWWHEISDSDAFDVPDLGEVVVVEDRGLCEECQDSLPCNQGYTECEHQFCILCLLKFLLDDRKLGQVSGCQVCGKGRVKDIPMKPAKGQE